MVPLHAGYPTGGVPGEREGQENKGNKHTRQKCSMAPKNIQMAAMDSPLFEYLVHYFLLKFHLVEETFVAQKKYAYYQSWT